MQDHLVHPNKIVEKKKPLDSLVKEARTLIYKHTIMFYYCNSLCDVMPLSLINMDTTFCKGIKDIKNFDRTSRYIFYDLITYLTDETWDLICTSKVKHNNYFNFFFFCLTDWPIIERDGAMGNETFYREGLIKPKKRIIFLLYL